jgi:hypothetical protein
MGGSSICMDQLGGRVGVDWWPSGLSVLTRARICRSRCRKKRGAPVRLGSASGALESWRRIRKDGSLCTCVMTCGEAACSGCRVLLERDSGSSGLFGDHAVVAGRARRNVYQPTQLALADCPVRVLLLIRYLWSSNSG